MSARIFIAAALCFAAFGAEAAELRTQSLLRQMRDPSGPVMVVAHRGCHTELSENSLAAIERCIEAGIDIVELDVRHSKDGVLVLMHDRTLGRMTNGKGHVPAFTLAELKRLRLKRGEGGRNAPLTDETIPTFEEALAVTNGRILVDLDAKGPDQARVWADSLKLVERLGMCDQIIGKMTAVRHGLLMNRLPLLARVNYLQRVTSHGPKLSGIARSPQAHRPLAYAVEFDALSYFKEGVDEVRATGARAWAGPFSSRSAGGHGDDAALTDPDANWGRLIDAGATMLLTDEPEALLAYLKQRGLRPSSR